MSCFSKEYLLYIFEVHLFVLFYKALSEMEALKTKGDDGQRLLTSRQNQFRSYYFSRCFSCSLWKRDM